LEKRYLIKKVIANVVDFDMHNLFEPRTPVDNLEDASSGGYEAQPLKTLRERNYNPVPLILVPKYHGDFLEKLKNQPVHGKPIKEGGGNANPENLWDFSMPSEWLKHQEKPHPRNLVDDFYSINSPGPEDQGDGNQALNEYWNSRGWDPSDAPEMSEDKIDRMQNFKDMKKRVASSFLSQITQDSMPNASNVVASFLMHNMPIELVIEINNVKTAKLLEDFKKSLITTKTRGTRPPGNATVGEGFLTVPGVTARLARAEPRVGRWTFATTSGRDVYRTVFQFIPYKNVRETSKLHVRTTCTCPSWLFWGAQYHAVMEDYLYGRIRPKFAPPSKRDPKGQFLVCKHVLACLPIVSRYKLGGITVEVKKRIEKEPKFQIEKKVPEEKLRIPKDLISVGRNPKIKDIVKRWDESPRKRRSWVMGLDPDEAAFIAHRFPQTSTALVAERLKQLAKMPKFKKEAEELLDEIQDIEKAPGAVKIPAPLKKYEMDPALQESLDGIKGESAKAKRKVVMEQTDPDQLAYMAFKLHDDDELLSSVLEKLDNMAKDTSSQMEDNRQTAKRWLREIL